MNLSCKIGIEVSKTDNGYVLEWKDETKEEHRMSEMRLRRFDRGLEVFTDKKALMKRIEALL